MACDIDRPDPQALFDRYRSLFSSNVLGGAPVIPESNEWYAVTNDYQIAEEFYAFAEQQWRERDPRFACCDNLIEIAACDGIYPNPATPSEGFIELTGDAQASLTGTLEVSYNDRLYRPAGTPPATLDDTGRAVIRYRAVQPGIDELTNNRQGQLVATLTGVNRAITVFGQQFCGGAAAETCEEFRTRYLNRKRFQPQADRAWLIEKIMEWPCVTRVCVRGENCCNDNQPCQTCCSCGTTHEYYPIMDDTFDCGLPPQCVVDEINDWLFGVDPGTGVAPLNVCGKLYAAEQGLVNINIDIPCSTIEDIETIRTRIADFFGSLCPSTDVDVQNFEIIVAQVVGVIEDVEISITALTDNIVIDDCGNIEPDCDVMPCLNEIIITGPQNTANDCL